MNIISFPGLGIDEFTINPVAFTVFGHNVAWYGIILTTAIIAGYLYAQFRARQAGIRSEDIMDYAIYTVISAIIGARLYYVLTNLGSYHTFYDAIAIWHGGIAIYGAIIGGTIAVIIVSLIKKLNFFKLADVFAPGVMLGQVIGRWGNFCNAEAHGYETTLPWRMGIAHTSRPDAVIYVHPTFLYESLWNLIGFILINLFYKKKRYDGQVFLWYLTWYGFGRMLIEGLRTDSLYVGAFRISQLVGFACALVGGILLVVFRFAPPKSAVSLSETTDPAEKSKD